MNPEWTLRHHLDFKPQRSCVPGHSRWCRAGACRWCKRRYLADALLDGS